LGGAIYIGGDFDYEGSSGLTLSHNMYVNGCLIYGGSAGAIVGPENIVVRGYGSSVSKPDTSISGGSTFGTPIAANLPFIIVPPAATPPAVISSDPSNITISGSGEMSGVIYAPTAAVTVSGGSTIFGAVMSASITLTGGTSNPTILYPSDLSTARTGLPGSGGITIKSYIIGGSTAGGVGPAAQLAFSQQPSNTISNLPVTPAVTVLVQDAGGNTVTTSTAAITLVIGTNPVGGILSGAVTVNAVNGAATFSNLSINKPGTGYTLTATSGTLTQVISNSFNITAGAAAKLFFSQQPSSAVSAAAITPAVTVTIQDSNGNTVTTSSAPITVAIGINPSGGTLSGTATVNAINGIATYTGLNIDDAGVGYTLIATSSSLTQSVSTTFFISPGAAVKLALRQQPGTTTAGAAIIPAVTVIVQDVNGNMVTSSTAAITMAIGTNRSAERFPGL
jgi:hypothetical protein